MGNQIVKALEDGAQKLGKTLAEDAGKALKNFYRHAGDNMKKVAKNVRDIEEKHAKDLEKIFKGEGKGLNHPRSGGGFGRRGGSHPKGRGREQVKSPRTEGRRHDSRCPGGEPVDMATGRMFIDQADASLPGSLPLLFTRSFESGLLTGRWMGPKWLCPFDERLELDEDGVVHVRADRITQAYPLPEPGDDPVYASAGSRHELALQDGLFTVTDPATGLVKTFTPTPDGTEALLTEVRDRHGRHYTLAYDEDGVPLSITHSGGYRLLVTVDADRITALRLAGASDSGGDALLMRYSYTDGHLTAVYNSSGKAMRFANDADGRILSWTDRNNSQYLYAYDAHDRVTDEGGAEGNLRFRFTYSEPDPTTGLATHTETNALGHTTTYLVNEHAQITAITDPLGHTTRTERDEYDRLLAETDPLGRTTRYEYDGAGDLIRITRPDGHHSTATYLDGLSLPTTVTQPGGATWHHTYDGSGLRTTDTDPLGATTRYGYDADGHLATITDALGHTTLISCNPAGLPVEVTDPLGGVSRYERDAFGLTVAITDPLGAVARLTWTSEGRPLTRTTADGAAESWTYDGEGNLLTHTDRLGRTTVLEHTHFDVLTARTTADGARHTFHYDADMRLIAVGDALGRQWTYAYDAAGRLVAETDFGGRTTTYELDAAGQLLTRTGPDGARTHHTYDLLGRAVRVDSAGRTTTFGYDPAGNLIAADNPDAVLTRTVDAVGNLLSETVNGRTVTHTRDVLGRSLTRRTPAGHASTRTYDAAGRPSALATPDGEIGFGYDTVGHEVARSIGGRLLISTTWDRRHRRTGQTVETGGTRLQQRSYAYYPDGSLQAVEDAISGTRTFALDQAGRVTGVQAREWTESYAYDRAGNITSAEWPATGAGAAPLGTRVYRDTRLTDAGRVRYEYDAVGRTTLRQVTRLSRKPDTWRYTWDADDRLTRVTTPDGTVWRYLYDPLGRRIAKQRLDDDGSTVVERTDFTWDDHTLVEQTTVAPYLPGPHTLSWEHSGLHPICQTETITTADASQEHVDRRFFAIVTDLVGAPAELIDTADHTIAWRATTTLWGCTSWSAASTTYTPLRFPGQYFDPETRLHYNVHRYYDPETGRYTSPDPLGLGPAPNPDSYVHNPLTWADPLGLSPHNHNPAPPETKIELPEVTAPKPLKPSEVEAAWDKFLGPGPHTNIHPRTGLPDPHRIVSADGRRSIRLGPHEMNSKPTKFHFHMETWDWHAPSNTWVIGNTMVRVPLK
ncbi:RHS repeat-associated core domain-containing protein [Kitasatospora sp. NPDC049285]|uniref:RHS repeat-associated core domain-containing protein n=1 Tax=Kitasatospora sp. NPDC049285 TaxID=3157096 RepID=UPI0034434F52